MAPSSQEMKQAKEQGSKHHEVEGEENEWKFKAPYKVHEKGSDFKALYEGGCHCGKVRYELGREKPLDAKFCHCTTCQVIHGAPFQWAAIFKKEDINFTHGHHDLAWYDSGEKTNRHKLPCKVSCAHCHSWIMDEGRNMILLFPSLIKFGGGKDHVEGEEKGREERRKKAQEEREKFTPSCHMFYGQRCVDVNDDLPKWEGMSKDSKLVDEGRGDHKVDKKKLEQEIKKKQEQKKEKEEDEKKHKREEEEENGKQGKKPKMDGKKQYDLR